MEEITLTKIGGELQVLKQMMEKIQEYVLEDELEISDEVIKEVKIARKGKNISHEDIVKEFCND